MNQALKEPRHLERTMFRAWPAFEEPEYDGWALRFSDGYTKRANSINPHFGSSLPLAAKIAHCEASYRERGLPTIFRLTPFSQPTNLDGTLAELGYETLDPTLVMTRFSKGAPGLETEPVLQVSADEWFGAFDQLQELETFERASHRRIIESSDGQCCFAAITEDGGPKACGLGVLVDDAIGLFDLHAAETHRRQGLGSSVVRSILQWGHQHDARSGFLQVHSLNVPARRLYERLGFEVAYPYWYRIKK